MSELLFLIEVVLPAAALAVLCAASWWLYRSHRSALLAFASIAFALASACAFLLAVTPVQVTLGVPVDDIAMSGPEALWLLAASRVGGAMALFAGAALLAAAALRLRSVGSRT